MYQKTVDNFASGDLRVTEIANGRLALAKGTGGFLELASPFRGDAFDPDPALHSDLSDEIADANARELVRRWNAFPLLVAALSEAASYIPNAGDRDMDLREQINAALAAAEEK